MDENSLHVKLADEAICVGPPAPMKSYLNVPSIIAACEVTGAEAIHPGYGFLSENADFSDICEANNIVFIGASARCINMMGNKSEAKKTMESLDVPIVPGSKGVISDLKSLKQVANDIGYPLLLKASAGGGGRGMRIVNEESELSNAYDMAHNEALSAFGNGDIYVEKFIGSPRHIEIQVLSDKTGHAIYLGERECSIQRRHQKLIEEAPSPVVSEEMRKRMGEAAIKAASGIKYEGAGTVEVYVGASEKCQGHLG